MPKIKGALLLHYAGLDTRINDGWPAYEAALKQAGVKYEAFVYPNVNHGFHNDTTSRYDEASAKLAWSRTVEFSRRRWDKRYQMRDDLASPVACAILVTTGRNRTILS